jgi:shikimate dehydrogenase
MHKIVGLVGYPLGHSLSPAMQNAAFKHLGLDCEYVLFEVEPKDLSEALHGMRALHIAGFNVTIPHKETILPLLDEVTQLACIIGAVNTVKTQEGLLVGYNTDGPGFIDSLKDGAKMNPKGKKVVLLGAGGASRAVSVMLAKAGVKSLFITDIQEEKAQDLVSYVGSYFEIESESIPANHHRLQKLIAEADLLVNSTPIGMHPKINESPLPEGIKLPKNLMVYDLVYNPAETKLIKTAKASGCKTFSGLDMLVRQGAMAFTIWTGLEAPLEVMRQAAEASLW